MIDIQNLCKNYGKKKVLNNLSLHVNKGDVLGFIGPNGAGKTTTMKMLCGVMPVYQGCIRLKSLDITQNPIQAKMITGYLPENAPEMGVRDIDFSCFRFKIPGFLHISGNIPAQLDDACMQKRVYLTVVGRLFTYLQQESFKHIGASGITETGRITEQILQFEHALIELFRIVDMENRCLVKWGKQFTLNK